MRKCKIESRRSVGCIKVMDNPGSNDNIGAVSGVNMLRVAIVLEVSAQLSRNPNRAARSHIAVLAHSLVGGGLTLSLSQVD
jgi:hypothetical protein